MKNFYLFYLIFLLVTPLSMSQPLLNEKPKFRFGFGIGMGFFYPEDVSNYIKRDLSYKHGDNIITWNTELYMDIVGSVALTFSPTNLLDLIGTLEYGWGPKYITNTDDYYHFDRISPGILCNYNIPFGSGRHSFFIGGGLFYHALNFEDISSSTVGPRIQAGVNFQFGKLNPQACISYDYAVSETEYTEYDYYYDYYYNYFSIPVRRKIKLNYSGILINLKLNI